MAYSESFQTILNRINPNDLKPVVFNMTSVDSNAFSLMGHWQKAARKAGWLSEDISIVLEECRSGDYNDLVCTLMEVSASESDEDEDEDYDPYSSRRGGNLYDDEDDSFIRKHLNSDAL